MPDTPPSPSSAAASTGPMQTIQKFLTLVQEFPFAAVIPAIAAGGTNIPADIAAAEAMIQEFASIIAAV